MSGQIGPKIPENLTWNPRKGQKVSGNRFQRLGSTPLNSYSTPDLIRFLFFYTLFFIGESNFIISERLWELGQKMELEPVNVFWGVLRCPGSATLRLADEFKSAGLEVYAPSLLVKVRLPRSNRRVFRHIPILPGFLFVGALDLAAAQEQAGEEARLFLLNGGRALFPVGQLIEMAEEIERRRALSRIGPHKLPEANSLRHPVVNGDPLPLEFLPTLGMEVEVTAGPFKGWRGIVREQSGVTSIVDFPNVSFRAQISALLLAPAPLSPE